MVRVALVVFVSVGRTSVGPSRVRRAGVGGVSRGGGSPGNGGLRWGFVLFFMAVGVDGEAVGGRGLVCLVIGDTSGSVMMGGSIWGSSGFWVGSVGVGVLLVVVVSLCWRGSSRRRGAGTRVVTVLSLGVRVRQPDI